MRRAAVAAIIIVALCAVASAEPVAHSAAGIRTYISAMRSALVEAGVQVTGIDAPRDELFIEYLVAADDLSPEFALAAVLRLATPISDDAKVIRVRQVRGGDVLLEVSVRPEEIETVLASTTTEAQREEIDALLATALEACGVREPEVPDARTAPDTRTPATVVQEGAAPVGGPELPALTTQRMTRPGSAADIVAVTESSEEDAEAPPAADSQTLAEDLFERLVADGLENLTVARAADGAWVISFENRTWRSDMDALAAALDDAANVLPPAAVVLQIKRHDVVVSHVRVALADYVKLQSGMLTVETLAQNWDAAPGEGELAQPVEVLAEGNESFLRTDLLARPAVDYTIGLENDPFESDYFVVTNVESTLAPGLWTNARFPAQVTSDEDVYIDRALATWVGRPFDGLLATGSVGTFRDDLHGYYGEIRTDTEEHQFGLVGSLVERDFDLSLTDKTNSAFAYYQHDWGELGLTSRFGYGQFLESGEEGLTLSLRRRFGESVIEARAIRTDDGDEGLTFGLSFPLGPRRAASPTALRPRLDPAFRVDYTSNFNAQGDYLRGPHDLESFRGEVSPAYVQHHGERLLPYRSEVVDGWPVAPSWEGTSGLIRIPTADVAPDGRLLTGISYLDQSHSKVVGDETDAMPTFIGAGFLPNLELIGRLTFFHDVRAFDWNYNLDRSFNVHYRLTGQQDEWLPALAVGAQDVTFGTTTSYVGEAEYMVGSLQRDDIRLHLGLGSGRLDPVFGGVDFAFDESHKLHLMADYDSDYVNTGLRWFMDDWGTASVGLLGLQDLTGCVTFQTELK